MENIFENIFKKVKEIKEGGKEDIKGGVDLTALAKKVAQKRMEEEKENGGESTIE